MNFEAAHVVAAAHGGPREVPNLRVSCRTCNGNSGTQNFDLYARDEEDSDLGHTFTAENAEIIHCSMIYGCALPTAMMKRYQWLRYSDSKLVHPLTGADVEFHA